MSRKVGLFDYGSGNLHSVARALATAGGDVLLSGSPEELRRCEALVVPGVGAFAACMAGLRAVGGVELLEGWLASGRPLLGICVGHQILFRSGNEHNRITPGLGLWPGDVVQLVARRLPHMGWNTVEASEGSRLFQGIEQERFYFVHSYGATGLAEPPRLAAQLRVTTATHEHPFVAAVECGNVCSTQFHPEKSGAAGARLLRNWLRLSAGQGVE
ncbi:MAG: imidazole glycerol phosphate synthase subunit HisH [Propionibacteriaceae bacterium]|nr:imidazole glycerol phosphate synthase subunit HisH [Propionibacteriaceae bacterium]